MKKKKKKKQKKVKKHQYDADAKWSCPSCTSINNAGETFCSVCFDEPDEGPKSVKKFSFRSLCVFCLFLLVSFFEVKIIVFYVSWKMK